MTPVGFSPGSGCGLCWRAWLLGKFWGQSLELNYIQRYGIMLSYIIYIYIITSSRQGRVVVASGKYWKMLCVIGIGTLWYSKTAIRRIRNESRMWNESLFWKISVEAPTRIAQALAFSYQPFSNPGICLSALKRNSNHRRPSNLPVTQRDGWGTPLIQKQQVERWRLPQHAVKSGWKNI